MHSAEEIYELFNKTDEGQEVWEMAKSEYPDYSTDSDEATDAAEQILDNIVNWYKEVHGIDIDDDTEDELFEAIIAGLS